MCSVCNKGFPVSPTSMCVLVPSMYDYKTTSLGVFCVGITPLTLEEKNNEKQKKYVPSVIA